MGVVPGGDENRVGLGVRERRRWIGGYDGETVFLARVAGADSG